MKTKKKKPIKLQIEKHLNNPKWIPPEKRMKRYEDYGIKDLTPGNDPRWKKVKWVDFRIVVPDIETRKQLEAACEYLHDNRLIDTNFLAVNSLVHAYENYTNTNGHYFDPFIVDFELFHHLKQRSCIHKKTYTLEGIKYCKDCWKALEITSWRERGC
jgi:hypothetical protein